MSEEETRDGADNEERGETEQPIDPVLPAGPTVVPIIPPAVVELVAAEAPTVRPIIPPAGAEAEAIE